LIKQLHVAYSLRPRMSGRCLSPV